MGRSKSVCAGQAERQRDEADRHRHEAEKQKGIAKQRAGGLEGSGELGRAEKAEKQSRDEAEAG